MVGTPLRAAPITSCLRSPSIAQAAGEIRADLERKGVRIGEYDTLIAGQAYARNMILATANMREFRRVKGLRVEDWTL